MTLIVIAMVVIVVLAAVVVTFVAYPSRGREIPRAPWLSDAMNRAAGKLRVETSDQPLLGQPSRDATSDEADKAESPLPGSDEASTVTADEFPAADTGRQRDRHP